jgi:uncharacterized protein (DUF2336 family)
MQSAEGSAPLASADDPMHNDLRNLAWERSSEKRLELLRKLSEMYFEDVGSHSDAEQYLFGEIVGKILDAVAAPEKVAAANAIATQVDFPHAAVVRLASDPDIEVARPVIAQSPVLADDDLARIAGEASQDHLTAIAGRPHLSETVTDVLIDRGDRTVVRTVSANHGAQFSPAGMNGLAEKARDDVDLRELLVERPDLSQAAVAKLLPLVSADLVVKLAERGHEIGDALSPEMAEQVSHRLANALRERKTNIRDTATLVEMVRAGRLTLDEAACLLAQAGRLVDLSALLSTFGNVERDYLFSLLSRGQLQAVMILFRSFGLSWTTLERVIAMRAKKRGDANPLRPSIRADYEAINPSAARRTLRFSHVRRSTAVA